MVGLIPMPWIKIREFGIALSFVCAFLCVSAMDGMYTSVLGVKEVGSALRWGRSKVWPTSYIIIIVTDY